MSHRNKDLHIYAQESWHDEAIISGSRSAMRRLAKLIQAAADGSPGCCGQFMTGDGEGYFVYVLPVEDGEVDTMQMPYTDEVARSESSEARSPHVMTHERMKEPTDER